MVKSNKKYVKSRPAINRIYREGFEWFAYEQIREGSSQLGITLGPEQEAYIAHIVLKTANNPTMISPATFSRSGKMTIDRFLVEVLAGGSDVAEHFPKYKLQELGDSILFTTGFFPDHYSRKGAHEFYQAIGSIAYRNAFSRLSHRDQQKARGMEALVEDFAGIAAVFTHMRIGAENAGIRNSTDEYKMLMRWLRTENPIHEQVLLRRGVPLQGMREHGEMPHYKPN